MKTFMLIAISILTMIIFSVGCIATLYINPAVMVLWIFGFAAGMIKISDHIIERES